MSIILRKDQWFATAVKERDTKNVFQGPDLVTDGAVGDTEFISGLR